MITSVAPLGTDEYRRVRQDDGGFGTLATARGNLPLDALDVKTYISGLTARTTVRTEFVNAHDTALEATYIFPLPDRAAVTGMTMTADGRTVEADLQERGAARETYDQAIAAGQRASIAEEERPDVFTLRVGNILPGERVIVSLRLAGPLPFEDGAATYRFPLVVAPRYIPGTPLPGTPVGDGTALDTDATPDASRITPPVLLPGFPNPLRLSISAEIDPAGLTLGEVRSSLHTVTEKDGVLTVAPGDKANRDFILRLGYAGGGESAVAVPDEEGEGGVYQVTVLPPEADAPPRPKDLVLVLDRSGSMGGWKMVAARRAAARIVDTLTGGDRLAVFAFDHTIEQLTVEGHEGGLVPATDRNRFRAVEFLAGLDARGGTEMLHPLREALRLLASDAVDRDRVVVLVTDGEVGNEDQILGQVTPQIGDVRVHAIGVDQAVNAGFLGRLAAAGAGRAELVESEDRLDEAMEHIHRRIGAPVVTGLTLTGDGLRPIEAERSPARLPGIYPGVPLVISGRYAGTAAGTVEVTGRTRDGREFRTTIPVLERAEPAIRARWARARVRDLEDAYAAWNTSVEQEIIDVSLRYRVLCRFTAYVAVDTRVVNEGGKTRRVTQPVEQPAGWAEPAAADLFVAGAAPQFSASMLPPGGAFQTAAPMAMPPMPPMPNSPRAGTGGGGMSFRSRKASGPARAAAPKRAAAVPVFGAAPASAPAPAAEAAPDTVQPVRAVAATEAQRLRDAAGRPEWERRELLDDLLSRLTVLTGGSRAPEFAPLRELITLLGGPSSVDDKWTAAVAALTAFAAGATAATKPAAGRKAFWKR